MPIPTNTGKAFGIVGALGQGISGFNQQNMDNQEAERQAAFQAAQLQHFFMKMQEERRQHDELVKTAQEKFKLEQGKLKLDQKIADAGIEDAKFKRDHPEIYGPNMRPRARNIFDILDELEQTNPEIAAQMKQRILQQETGGAAKGVGPTQIQAELNRMIENETKKVGTAQKGIEGGVMMGDPAAVKSNDSLNAVLSGLGTPQWNAQQIPQIIQQLQQMAQQSNAAGIGTGLGGTPDINAAPAVSGREAAIAALRGEYPDFDDKKHDGIREAAIQKKMAEMGIK